MWASLSPTNQPTQ